MSTVQLVKYLSMIMTLVDVGSLAWARLQESRARLKTIMDEGREPTDAEWEAVFADIETNHNIIQGS